MAALEFQTAAGKINYDAGLTPEGRIIHKAKAYRFIEKDVSPENLQAALAALSQLSSWTVLTYEKIVTSTVTD